VEGLECLAGGVVVSAGAEGGADAVAVELLSHRFDGAADGEADVPFAEMFDSAGEGRCCGVVDVADGRGVENKPPQRASVPGQGGDVVDEAGGVGVIGGWCRTGRRRVLFRSVRRGGRGLAASARPVTSSAGCCAGGKCGAGDR
jgi:hypothetical protein